MSVVRDDEIILLRNSTCANGRFGRWFFHDFSCSVGWCSSSILIFRGVSPPKLKTKLNVTLTLHFGEGIAFLFFWQIQWSFIYVNLPVAYSEIFLWQILPLFFAQPGLASRFPTKLCLGTVRCCQGSICYVKKFLGKTPGFFFYANFGGWSLRFKGKTPSPVWGSTILLFVARCFVWYLIWLGHPLKIILWLIHVWVHQCPPQRYGRDRKIVGVFFFFAQPQILKSISRCRWLFSQVMQIKSSNHVFFFFSKKHQIKARWSSTPLGYGWFMATQQKTHLRT